MEIRVDFTSLINAVQRMGAPVRDVPLGDFRLDDISPISIELEHGIDVELKDIEINEGGLLGYQGHQVVLYIPDQGWRIQEVLEDGAKGRKVHVANCITLDEMKRRGRFERYVVRNGLSAIFPVSGITRDGDNVEGDAELRVCMNCMKLLNYKNFNNKKRVVRQAIVSEFSLDQFFATYSSYFKYMPQRKAEELGTNRYNSNWSDTSRRYRENLGWTCENCAVDLSSHSHRKLLHVHHINGVKGDDSLENLKGLCIDCHSKEEMHQHLFVRRSERTIIQRLRRQQQKYKAPKSQSFDLDDWRDALLIADPAVHGLLGELKAQEYPVPEVGADIVHPESRRIIYSNAELAWPGLQEIVILERTPECDKLEQLGWKVFTAQGLLDWLNEQKS